VQQLCAFGVWCVFQDGTGLAPGYEGAFGRECVVVAWCDGEGVSRCEGCDAAAVGLIEQRLGGCGAADPARVVG